MQNRVWGLHSVLSNGCEDFVELILKVEMETEDGEAS
jgi:hypothetical protein